MSRTVEPRGQTNPVYATAEKKPCPKSTSTMRWPWLFALLPVMICKQISQVELEVMEGGDAGGMRTGSSGPHLCATHNCLWDYLGATTASRATVLVTIVGMRVLAGNGGRTVLGTSTKPTQRSTCREVIGVSTRGSTLIYQHSLR